jgi:alpha-acetolactate decarboxylase
MSDGRRRHFNGKREEIMKWIGSVPAALAALTLAAFPMQKSYEVHWVGELHKVMMLGEDQGVISLEELKDKPNLYALGPLEGLNGEISVFNSEPLSVTIREGKPVIEKTFDVRAPLLVWVQVPKWSEVSIPSSVRSLSDLDRFAAQSAAKAGLDTTAPFPFRVTAHVEEISLHVVNRQGRIVHGMQDHEKIHVKFPVTNTEVELIGFWSDHHQGIFTHMGSNVHVHGRTTDGGLSGHVEELTMGSGRLWLPAGS